MRKKLHKAQKALKSAEQEIKEARTATKKACKEIREAEQATGKAYDETADAAEVTKGKQKKNFVGALRDLEKAVYTAGESSEATEEADFRFRKPKKNSKKRVAKKRK